jgi:hypothetical protein
MSHTDEQSPHRLFAAIVLMGTGLAVGCGGIAEGEREVSTGGRPNATTGGTGTGATGSGVAGTGVGAATSTGGSLNIPPQLGIGGTTPVPEAVEPGPFKCPPEQWSCASNECDYSSYGWVLPDGCDCDPKRPLSASDCGPGQVFVCQEVTTAADGRPFTKPVALSCSCVQKAMYFCTTECDAAYGQRDLSCQGGSDELSALCGCAVIYLK